MDQPSLGKKIVELRKAQGLTQKELVERCNLNVRTLQRIESGEVTPRSYTLKLILEKLNYQDNTVYVKKSRFQNWIEKTVPFHYKTTVSFLSIFLIILIIISAYYFNTSNSLEVKAKNEIEASQNNITQWINNKNLEAIVSKFRNDACINNSICGKENIKNALKINLNNGYKVIKHTTISIKYNNDVAFESYVFTYEYKGSTRTQNGIMEWHLTNGEWLIVNDIYNE